MASSKRFRTCNSTIIPSSPIARTFRPITILTFSYSGVPAYQTQVRLALAAGMRMAVVFGKRATVNAHAGERHQVSWAWISSTATIPTFATLTRWAPLVALYAKGSGKYDRTGFVVRRESTQCINMRPAMVSVHSLA